MPRGRPNVIQMVLAGLAQGVPNYLQAAAARRQEERQQTLDADVRARQDKKDALDAEDRQQDRRNQQSKLALDAMQYVPEPERAKLFRRSVDLNTGAEAVNPAISSMTPAQRSTASTGADIALRGFAGASGSPIARERTPQIGSVLEGVTIDPAGVRVAEEDRAINNALRSLKMNNVNVDWNKYVNPQEKGFNRNLELLYAATGKRPVVPDPLAMGPEQDAPLQDYKSMYDPGSQPGETTDERNHAQQLALLNLRGDNSDRAIKLRGQIALAGRVIASNASLQNNLNGVRLRRANELVQQGYGAPEAWQSALAEFPGTGAVSLEEALSSIGINEPAVPTMPAPSGAPSQAAPMFGGLANEAITDLAGGREVQPELGADAPLSEVFARNAGRPQSFVSGMLKPGVTPGLQPTQNAAGVPQQDLWGAIARKALGGEALSPKNAPLDQFLMSKLQEMQQQQQPQVPTGQPQYPASTGTPLPNVAAQIAQRTAAAQNQQAQTEKAKAELKYILPLKQNEMQARIRNYDARTAFQVAMQGMLEPRLDLDRKKLLQQAWMDSASIKLGQGRLLLQKQKGLLPDYGGAVTELNAITNLFAKNNTARKTGGKSILNPDAMTKLQSRMEQVLDLIGVQDEEEGSDMEMGNSTDSPSVGVETINPKTVRRRFTGVTLNGVTYPPIEGTYDEILAKVKDKKIVNQLWNSR